jgi:hypothetical protein
VCGICSILIFKEVGAAVMGRNVVDIGRDIFGRDFEKLIFGEACSATWNLSCQ